MDKLIFFKLLGEDRKTHGGFEWPESGVVECDPEKISPENTGVCPLYPGDGLCVAVNWRGATSGGYPIRYYAKVAVKPADLLAFDVHAGKARARAVEVLEVKPISWANLSMANLSGADLSGADLSGADLSGADLSGADLSWANLSMANLTGAHLARADLAGAHLSWAILSRANLTGSDLTWANLSEADLYRANLSGAKHSPSTIWPDGFDMSRLS